MCPAKKPIFTKRTTQKKEQPRGRRARAVSDDRILAKRPKGLADTFFLFVK